MRSFSVLALGVLAGLIGSPLTAQIPTNSRIGSQPAQSLPKLMVSNPYARRSEDSLTSVQIANALRNRMERVASGTYQVVTRAQMNEALVGYGYTPDAILQPPVQRQFASAVNARVLLGTHMAQSSAGQVTVTARLIGLNDDAGTVVVATRSSGQSLDAFGTSIADQLQPVVKAAKDAKACVDQRTTDAKKAETAARRALTTNPKNGLAHLCLAQLASDRKAPSDSLIQMLNRAIEGDPQSLPALVMLAKEFQTRADTTKLATTYMQMLVAAPTNDQLRAEALRFLLSAGRLDLARKVAEDALALDEFNPELYDLMSNVCIFENNYKCAVDALEQLFAIDSTKADSSFYIKIAAVASQPSESPDTVRLIKWTQAGVNKNPTNSTLVSQLLGAYALRGEADSMVSVAQRLLAIDTTNVAPALLVINELAKQNRGQDAAALIEVVKRRGTPDDKEQVAIVMVNAAFKLLQEPQDLVKAAELARQARGMVDSATSTRAWPNAGYALGIATVVQVSKLDPQTEAQKSCEMARQEDALVTESIAALTSSRSVNPSQVDTYLGYLNSLKPRVASMIRAYCR
jgi:tetratricopeptide (TPR) repeat protein